MIYKKSNIVHIILLIIIMICTLFIGRYSIDFGRLLSNGVNSQDYAIIFNIRLPRTLLVAMSGGALALAGMVFQSIFQNPLISPDVLGVSSGCSLGAALAITLWGSSQIVVGVSTFTFGLLAVIFSLLLAKNMSNNKVLALVISGIVTGAIANAFVMILKYFADPYKDLPAIEFWLMGGFHNSSWKNVIYILPVIVISIAILYLLRWQLKITTMGDTQASLLGVDVKKIRLIAIIVSTLLVAVVVSVAGLVSWVGLLAPHIVKSYSEDDITKNLCLTVTMGGIILLIADTAARTILPTELPISILTSLVGAPYLVYLLNKRGDGNKN